MINTQKINSLIAILAAIVGIYAWASTQYTSYIISDINSLYSNPTRANPFAVANANEACNKAVFRAQMSALRKGKSEKRAAENAKSKCKTFPKEDVKQWELSLSFTNKGLNSMNDITVDYIAITDTGEAKERGTLKHPILGGGERFHTEDIKVSSPIPKALLCFKYESGLFRDSWKVFSGKPANAHISMFEGGWGRFKLEAEGHSWFFGNKCGKELEKLLTKYS